MNKKLYSILILYSAIISCDQPGSNIEILPSGHGLITNFTITGQVAQAVINDETSTVIVSMPLGYDLTTELNPTITVSAGANISPASETAQNFSNSINNPFEYTVTAEDGTKKTYRVTVGILPVLTYNPHDSNRLGAGDLYKTDLFRVSNIEDGDYDYSITLGNYTRSRMETATRNEFYVSLVIPSSRNDGSDRVSAGNDGDITLSVSIDGTQYFNRTVNKEQYSLKTPEDVQGIQHDLSGDYTLMNDVDMTEIYFIPIAYDTNANDDAYNGTKFSGTINGKGNEISNLRITSNNRYSGLIAYTTVDARLNNIALTNINLVTQSGYSGGLVGWNEGIITNSYSTGMIAGSTNAILGSSVLGGFVGWNEGIIANSYSEAITEGYSVIGGLVGYNNKTITNSYSTGAVTGTEILRGLVGYNSQTGIVTSSYWDIGTSGQNTNYGTGIGINPSSRY